MSTYDADGADDADGAARLADAMDGINLPALEDSFAALAPRGEELVQRLFQRLFDEHPEVESRFASVSMPEVQEKFLRTLRLVSVSLRAPDALHPLLFQLGQRHRSYGADAAQYEAVASALVDQMSEMSGDDWTDELSDGWTSVLAGITAVMMDARDDADESERGSDDRPPLCTITPTQNEDIRTIRVRGAFSFGAGPEFRAAYEAAPAGTTHVVVDMKGVEHVDSSALGMLVRMKKHTEATESRVSIVNCNDHLRRLFQIAHLDSIFQIS